VENKIVVIFLFKPKLLFFYVLNYWTMFMLHVLYLKLDLNFTNWFQSWTNWQKDPL